MLETRKSTTFTGTSNIKVDGKNMAVASLSASISEEGTPNISKSILNRELYIANKEEVSNDMMEFEDLAFSCIQ